MVNCRRAESWELEPGGRNRDPGDPATLGVVCRVSGLCMLTFKITCFWPHWVFGVHGLLAVAASLVEERRLQWLWHMVLVAPRHVGSSGPGIEPPSPALAGGVLATGPRGKSQSLA